MGYGWSEQLRCQKIEKRRHSIRTASALRYRLPTNRLQLTKLRWAGLIERTLALNGRVESKVPHTAVGQRVC